MANRDNWEEVLTKSFWYEMNEVYTSMPCIVVSIVDDLKEQRVNIQPCLNKLRLNNTSSPRSVILNVPVIFPSTSTSAITMPVNIGDIVWGMFSMRAMEVFSESDGKPSIPNNRAKFDQKDAVALIGMSTRRTAVNNPNKRIHQHSTEDLVIAHNLGKSSEVEIRFKPDGDVLINSPKKVTVNSVQAVVNASTSASITTPDLTINADVTNWSGDIYHTGDITIVGSTTQVGTITATEVVGGGKSLSSHAHAGSPSAPSGPVTPTGSPI